MKKIFVIAAISFMGLLTACGPVQLPVAVVQSPNQPAPSPAYFQPQQQQQQFQQPQQVQQPQIYQVGQVPAQAPQMQQVAYQQVPPMQGITMEQLQQYLAAQNANAQQQQQQPRVQSISYAGRNISPQNVGKVAGCDLFEMQLDVGPVTIAKCPGFNGPTFIQVSPATNSVANKNRPGGGLLMFNGAKEETSEGTEVASVH